MKVLLIAYDIHWFPQGQDIDSFLRKFASEDSALGCIPTAEEVAQICLFLASQKLLPLPGNA